MRISSLFLATAVLSAPALAQIAAAPQLSRTELAGEVEANFKTLDTNADGIVTKPEIAAAQQKMLERAGAAAKSKFAEEFRKLDTNTDGMLSMAEFTAAAPDVRARASADARLDKYDANSDGKITLEEVRGPVLSNFDRLDANKDGVLTANEQQKPAAAAPQGR